MQDKYLQCVVSRLDRVTGFGDCKTEREFKLFRNNCGPAGIHFEAKT